MSQIPHLRLVAEDAMDQLTDALASGQSEVVLSGCAGTGKTTLVKQLRGSIALCAPTNKAARRLAQVTQRDTTTVHSLIYGQAIEEWVKPDGEACKGYLPEDGGPRVKPPGCPGCQCTSQLSFGAPKEMDDARLVVVDEASMVGRKMADDIRRAVAQHTEGAQILWVGDPAQLPPVKDVHGVDLHDADVMLEKVWRADGGILGIATDIRHAEDFNAIEAILDRAERGHYPDVEVMRGGVGAVSEWRAAGAGRMVITHTNRDRQGVNHGVRQILAPMRAQQGRFGDLVAGDRLLVRANVRDRDGAVVIINSEVYAAVATELLGAFVVVDAMLDGEVGLSRRFIAHPGYLGEQTNDAWGRQSRIMRDELKPHTERCKACRDADQILCAECGYEARWLSAGRGWCEACGGPRDLVFSTPDDECTCGPCAGLPLVNVQYGYAITAHAAQGSEAGEVGVLWTPWSHRRDFATGRSWLYTAVTRARSSLRIWR